MDELFNLFSAKYSRTGIQFVRGLEQEIEWKAQLIGIQGARGVGKTTLLLQHIKLHHKLDGTTLYASADNIWFNAHSIYELATIFSQRGGRYLFLDEVHKYPNWSREIKEIYDLYESDMRIVISGSSLLSLQQGDADLSRRCVNHDIQGLSFRNFETLHFSQKK